MRSRVIVALILVSGCVMKTGQWPDLDPTLVSPRGSTAFIVAGTKSLRGELLEVQDTAIVVLTDSRVVLAPFRAFDRATFVDADFPVTLEPSAMARGDRGALRRLSRYPSGTPKIAL